MGIENVVTLSIFAGLATAVGGFLSSFLPVHRRGCLGMVFGVCRWGYDRTFFVWLNAGGLLSVSVDLASFLWFHLWYF